MKSISLDLRRRIVEAYLSGRSGTYQTTAEMFGVGVATVSRLLHLNREHGDLRAKARGGNRAREVDEDWLRAHAQEQPDARLIDRVQAWEAYRGKRVQVSTMCLAMRRIGWTHKKNSGRKGT
jgi:transposase